MKVEKKQARPFDGYGRKNSFQHQYCNKVPHIFSWSVLQVAQHVKEDGQGMGGTYGRHMDNDCLNLQTALIRNVAVITRDIQLLSDTKKPRGLLICPPNLSKELVKAPIVPGATTIKINKSSILPKNATRYYYDKSQRVGGGKELLPVACCYMNLLPCSACP